MDLMHPWFCSDPRTARTAKKPRLQVYYSGSLYKIPVRRIYGKNMFNKAEDISSTAYLLTLVSLTEKPFLSSALNML